MLAGLSYSKIEAEAYLEAINWINRIPNSNRAASSPYESMTKTRSFLPQYHFGQSDYFIPTIRNRTSAVNGVFFLSNGSNPRYLHE
jgi:hypothetical protein